MDSSGFAEKVLEWKWTDDCTDALISNFHCALVKCGQRWSILTIVIGCMVSADYWLVDYSEMRRATQPSIIGGPLGEPGFCIFWQCCQLTKNYAYFDNHASNMAASSWTIGHGLWRKKLLGCQSDQYLVMSGWLNRFIGRIWRPGERLAVALVYHYYTVPSNPFTLFL